MSRTEKDLRDALNELDRRAAEHGAPSADTIFDRIAVTPVGHQRRESDRRFPRWIPPLAAAAVVAAAGVTAAVITTGSDGPSSPAGPAGAGSSPTYSAATQPPPTRTATPSPTAPTPSETPSSGKALPLPGPSSTGTSAPTSAPSSSSSAAADILEDAANKLDAMPSLPSPGASEYYYRKTTDSISWTSVSGRKPGAGHNSDGVRENIPGCRHGHYVGGGTSGSCTLNDVAHYRADAPTTPSAWDAYLEQIAPGAKAADAQGKIIIGVLHEDLIGPAASAALLRYTESCPGLHLVKTKPVTGEQLTGVTCTSMSNGSYGLAFDASSHAFVGFVPVDYQTGKQNYPAEIVRRTAVVKAIGDKP